MEARKLGYLYKFVEVPRKAGLKGKPGDTFEACKEIIVREAAKGWRLKQVVTPYNEKTGVYGALGYQIILEKIESDEVEE